MRRTCASAQTASKFTSMLTIELIFCGGTLFLKSESFFSTFWGHYKLHAKRWSWTCWPLRRFLLFSIKHITQVSYNSHAVGVRYCPSCRYGRCAAIVVFFTMLQNFVSFSFWLSFGKAEPSLSQILSGSVKDWCKEDRTDVGRATAMAAAWELT